MMKSLLLSSTAFALVIAAPAVALAQTTSSGANGSTGGDSCPPGSWFCAPAAQQGAPGGQPVNKLQQLPEDQESEEQGGQNPPSVTYAPPPPQARQPPVVVYQPPPPTQVVRPEAPPPYVYAPASHSAYPGRPHEWGLNLHLEGAMMGSGAAQGSHMGGLGAGLRFKPTRTFGIEADLDFAGGQDYQGNNRNESAFTLNGLIFLNPKSWAQIYLLGGFGWSSAHVTDNAGQLDANYSYFGGQAGVGLELRLTRVLAFNVDLRGFIRGRTDQLAQTTPEYTDGYGRSTNTSGGALMTGGMTLYF
jgi:hypothetical protein